MSPSGAPLLPPSHTAPLASQPLRRPAGASVPEPRQGRGKRCPPCPRGTSAGGTIPRADPGVRAAASDLLRAAKSSSPAAERGEPRPSPVSRECLCCRASLRSSRTGSPAAASRPTLLSLPPELSRRDFYTAGREPDPRFDLAEPGLRRGGERREGRRAPEQSERPRCPLV